MQNSGGWYDELVSWGMGMCWDGSKDSLTHWWVIHYFLTLEGRYKVFFFLNKMHMYNLSIF